ncbi:MAG TPA: J domain-containing protein [Candidatus Obscuribacterales bacterium]
MKYTDYYATLGIEKSASEQDIRKAYRRLAKDYHPDTHPGDTGAELKFKEINEAYEVLSDRNKRVRYDQLGDNWNQYQDLGTGFSGFGGGSRRNGRHKVEFGSQIFDLNFSDFFETFFGDQAGSFWEQHGGQRPPDEAPPEPAPQSGQSEQADLQYTAEILLEEALSGTKRRIQVREDNELRTIDVKIPAGVKDGSKVRVGSNSGNFFLEIKLRPHQVFQPEGNHLRCSLAVMEYEALLGSTRTVPTLNGSVQMKIPAGSQAGQTFRIRGQGLPELRHPEQRGDLLVSLEIRISKNLSDEEQALIERFKTLREAAAATG